VGLEELNYRRFFDVTSLVALRMELPEVFDAAHALILKWLRNGKISGLRVDHPDGLWDPEQYFQRLRHALDGAGNSQPHILAEKILTGDEQLPENWPIDGTTGYDFLNKVNGLFVDAANAGAFDAFYTEFTGCAADFGAVVNSSKRSVLFGLFQSELDALAVRLKRLAADTAHGADFTLSQLKAALAEVLISFPVYRTYITARNARGIETGKATRYASSLRPAEQKWIGDAVGAARAANPSLDGRLFNWLETVLQLEPLDSSEPHNEQERLEFVMRFQQLTGPLMAKGLEDTTFYRFNRLISLNEVGGDPGRFGVSVDAFHAYNLSQAAHWPHSLLATATHDTKRGEDVRARLNLLSEMPGEWAEAVRRWHNLNAGQRTLIAGEPAPHPNDEYLLYQTLAGAWVPEAESTEGSKDFLERVRAFMLKAAREAKTHTSWLDPNQAYEDAVSRFVTNILSKPGSPFLADFQQFQRRLAFFGQFNSLSQTLLKLTSPGVPDIYQGTELWDFSLVDPDNRRPVDFSLRRRILTGLAHEVKAAKGNLAPVLERLLRDSSTGEIKLFLIWRALKFRAEHREIFEQGRYIPLGASGARREHVCAFTRAWGNQQVLVVAPRLVPGLTDGVERPPLAEIWQDTSLDIPQQPAGNCYRNVLTEQVLQPQATKLRLQDLLQDFPVGLFERVPAAHSRRRELSSTNAKAPERWRSQRRYRLNGPRKTRRRLGLR
jgi:(1->4)-alpha-D-glucan 1-alpha-D-glucosylmutase